MDFESKELILLVLTIYDPCVSLINRATDTKMSQTKSHNVPLWLLRACVNDWQKIVRCGKYAARHYLGSSCQYCSK